MSGTTATLSNVIDLTVLPIDLTTLFGDGSVYLNSSSLSVVSFSCKTGFFEDGQECVAACTDKYELGGKCFASLTAIQALEYSKQQTSYTYDNQTSFDAVSHKETLVTMKENSMIKVDVSGAIHYVSVYDGQFIEFKMADTTEAEITILTKTNVEYIVNVTDLFGNGIVHF